MLAKLFILLPLLSMPFAMAAQQESKTTQNAPHPNLDYKQMGAPMPQLVFLAYHDTSTQGDAVTKKNRRKKKSEVMPVDSSSVGKYSVVTDKDLDNGANLLVMMFNPTCSHCEEMTMLMSQNIDAFKKSKVVLLATRQMATYIPDFAERRQISKYPPMYIGYDSLKFVEELFLYQTLPQINIYNSNRKLIKTYNGEVPIDTLKKYIE